MKELRRGFHEAAPNECGEIAIEGVHLLEEAIRSGLKPAVVYFSESASERAHKILPQLGVRTEALLLPDETFASAVPTENPQGVAALVKPKTFSLETALAATPALLLLVAGLQDPGNLGTVARSAEAFGASGLLLGEGTVSPWNWKALRASAGSLFRLPAVKVELQSMLRDLKTRSIRVLATSSHKGTPLPEASLAGPTALMVGNEGAGVPKDLLAEADEIISIPHAPRVESLNAAVATSIVLYEASRQRGGEFA